MFRPGVSWKFFFLPGKSIFLLYEQDSRWQLFEKEKHWCFEGWLEALNYGKHTSISNPIASLTELVTACEFSLNLWSIEKKQSSFKMRNTLGRDGNGLCPGPVCVGCLKYPVFPICNIVWLASTLRSSHYMIVSVNLLSVSHFLPLSSWK